jgi:predicted signal transduction protein with EAL and GGDEF domain
LRRDGSRFALEWTSHPVPLEGQTLSVVTLRDISLCKELEDKLSRLAQYDMLTGLTNRSLFMDRLATAALRSGQANWPLAVLVLDLDGFKAINGGFGHREGDAVLASARPCIRRRISAQHRGLDQPCRQRDVRGQASGQECLPHRRGGGGRLGAHSPHLPMYFL